MATVTYRDYLDELHAFSVKHNKKADLQVYTSAMVNNSYHKEYVWSDGAQFFEVTDMVTEEAVGEVHGVQVTFPVTFWRVEFWSTEDAKSKYFYEKA